MLRLWLVTGGATARRTNVVYLLPPLLTSVVPEPAILETRVVVANVFRSGLVMLVREATVPAGEHAYRLRQIPQALENTFWHDSPDGAEISDLKTSLELKPLEADTAPTTIAQFLRANVGKHIELERKTVKGNKTVSGQELAIDSNLQTPTITIRLSGDSIEEVSSLEIASLSVKGLTGKNIARGISASLNMALKREPKNRVSSEVTLLRRAPLGP